MGGRGAVAGENWEDECYNDIAGWELPVPWVTNVPDSTWRQAPPPPAFSHVYTPTGARHHCMLDVFVCRVCRCAPTAGKLQLTYTSTASGCRADANERREIRRRLLTDS